MIQNGLFWCRAQGVHQGLTELQLTEDNLEVKPDISVHDCVVHINHQCTQTSPGTSPSDLSVLLSELLQCLITLIAWKPQIIISRGFFDLLYFSSQGCTDLNWSHCSLNTVMNFPLYLPH